MTPKKFPADTLVAIINAFVLMTVTSFILFNVAGMPFLLYFFFLICIIIPSFVFSLVIAIIPYVISKAVIRHNLLTEKITDNERD